MATTSPWRAPIALERATEPLFPLPEWPTGYALRPMDASDARDRAGWQRVCNKAFRRMFGARSYERMVAERPGFNLHATMLLERDAKIVGAISVKSPADAPDVGMVHLIALDPGEHGKGLGKSLIIHGFQVAVRAGASRLEVESTLHDKASMGIFHGLGFRRKERLDEWNLRRGRLQARLADRLYQRRFGGMA